MLQYQNKKGFSLIETLFGMAFIVIVVAGITEMFKPFFSQLETAKYTKTGDIYEYTYDIQKNKSFGKLFYVSDDGTSLKIYRNPDCSIEYFYDSDTHSLRKILDCAEEYIEEGDNRIIVNNISDASFSQELYNISLSIKQDSQNYEQNFGF